MSAPRPHPPARLWTWRAADGVLCVACCDCGAVLAGAAEAPEAAPAHVLQSPPAPSRDPRCDLAGGGTIPAGFSL